MIAPYFILSVLYVRFFHDHLTGVCNSVTLTISPLNKIIEHSKATLRTISYSDLGGIKLILL